VRYSWVGDIADFAKYGLLKRLAGDDLRLGVFWYLTTHAAPNKPLVSYLSRAEEYGPCDRALFETLRRLHDEKGDSLTLDDIQHGGVLPAATAFHASALSTTALDRPTRLAARKRWFEDGCALTRDCDVIFVDPDTGLLPPGRKAENAGGEEYATLDELLALCRRGQSVVCVQFGAPQHFEKEPAIARQRLVALSATLTANTLPEPWGLWWQDGHKVGLLVVPNARHSVALRARTDAILADAGWRKKVIAL